MLIEYIKSAMADVVEETPLSLRVKELKELSQALYPNTPEWYITLSVESYIRQHESELLEYLDAEPPAEPDNKSSANIEDKPDKAE